MLIKKEYLVQDTGPFVEVRISFLPKVPRPCKPYTGKQGKRSMQHILAYRGDFVYTI